MEVAYKPVGKINKIDNIVQEKYNLINYLALFGERIMEEGAGTSISDGRFYTVPAEKTLFITNITFGLKCVPASATSNALLMIYRTNDIISELWNTDTINHSTINLSYPIPLKIRSNETLFGVCFATDDVWWSTVTGYLIQNNMISKFV